MSQEQIQKQTPQKKKEETEPQIQPKVSEGATDAMDELDALLEEIDSVLEVNAAEFVKNYIQGGGE